jgi:hypothetical protein
MDLTSKSAISDLVSEFKVINLTPVVEQELLAA